MQRQRGGGNLRRTKLLSLSKLSIVSECPLRYLYETELLTRPLPENPLGILGHCIHSTLQKIARKQLTSLDQVMGSVEESLVKKLTAHEVAKRILECLNVAPASWARVVIPSAQFVERIRIASRFLDETVGKAGATNRRVRGVGLPRGTLGSEVAGRSMTLGIAGRADLVQQVGPNTLRVTEFKTGKVFDQNGRVKSAAFLQVAGYGLIQREKRPGTRVLLRILGLDGEWQAELDDRVANELFRIVDEAVRVVPAGQALNAEELARPGKICVKCSYRHECRTYGHWAIEQWKRPGAEMPFDTVGKIAEIKESQSGLTSMRLLDLAGRHVAIKNVPSALTASLHVGARICLYQLSSAEVGRGNAYPSNFFVVDLGRPARSAFGAYMAGLS